MIVVLEKDGFTVKLEHGRYWLYHKDQDGDLAMLFNLERYGSLENWIKEIKEKRIVSLQRQIDTHQHKLRILEQDLKFWEDVEIT